MAIRPRGMSGVVLGAAAAMLVGSLASPRAQQTASPQAEPQQGGQRGQRGGTPAGEGQRGAPGPAAKPIVPVAASTLADKPDSFIGENVTLTAPVGQSLGATAFAVDPGKNAKGAILVLAPRLNAPVVQSSYVTAIGRVVKFDPEEVAKQSKDIKIDLPPDVVAKYRGQPAILATSVINAAGVNLALRLPPAMTTEEQAFQKVMQQVGPANTALRAALDQMDANAAKENAAILQQAFVKTEAFWKTRAKTEAVQIAQNAHKDVDAVNQSLATAKWDEAKTSAASLAQKCAACHGEYRERFDDGSFRIKAPGPR